MELGPRDIPGKLDETPRVTEIKVRESFEKQLGISNERDVCSANFSKFTTLLSMFEILCVIPCT
jgi:hypothetical protein